MTRKSVVFAVLAVLGRLLSTIIEISQTSAQRTDYEVLVNRRVLPIPPPWQPPVRILDAHNACSSPLAFGVFRWRRWI